MREILFRGKLVDTGEWVYGSFCMDALEQFNGLCGIDGFIRLYDKLKGKMQSYEVDRETVGQYTGLEDKNGKRIFEGDIVKGLNCTGVWTGYVIWIDKISGFGLKWIHRDAPTSFENCPMIRFLTSQCGRPGEYLAEIIGNIHDNPELMDGGAE